MKYIYLLLAVATAIVLVAIFWPKKPALPPAPKESSTDKPSEEKKNESNDSPNAYV